MSKSVNGPTDAQKHEHRLESHPISSPRAFGSGELKSSKMCTKKEVHIFNVNNLYAQFK